MSLATGSVIVTGGGTGIGAACALELARRGAAVTVCGRTEQKLTRFCDEARQLLPSCDVDYVVADVTIESELEHAVHRAATKDKPLRGVVANAGGAAGFRPLHLQRADRFIEVLHLNVVGTFLLIKHAVPHLVASGGGSFVAISSIAATTTHPYFGAYTAAKAGVDQLVRNAADEYGAVNVRFNGVRPGFVATELMDDIDRDGDVYASYIENTPMRGVASPDQVADVVSFLLGSRSSWVTGQLINVDGGHGLRRGPDFGPIVRQRLSDSQLLAIDAD